MMMCMDEGDPLHKEQVAVIGNDAGMLLVLSSAL